MVNFVSQPDIVLPSLIFVPSLPSLILVPNISLFVKVHMEGGQVKLDQNPNCSLKEDKGHKEETANDPNVQLGRVRHWWGDDAQRAEHGC